MTKEEIKFVINETMGEALDMTTPLLSIKNIKISKLEDKRPKINNIRFKFDMTNELLKCYVCRKYEGDIPSNWEINKHYDIYNNITYKYLFNETTMEPYVDVYDFASIVMIEC